MKRHVLLFAAMCCVISTDNAMGHGITGWLEESTGLRVIAEYDDGEPISYAKVEVNAPKSETLFQTGYTDRNGFFLFIPDCEGTWQVTVDDGMGHRLVLAENVTADKALLPSTTGPIKSNRVAGILGGLGIIAGLGGLLFGMQQRKKLLLTQDPQHG